MDVDNNALPIFCEYPPENQDMKKHHVYTYKQTHKQTNK